jgi:hypothetical protein
LENVLKLGIPWGEVKGILLPTKNRLKGKKMGIGQGWSQAWVWTVSLERVVNILAVKALIFPWWRWGALRLSEILIGNASKCTEKGKVT